MTAATIGIGADITPDWFDWVAVERAIARKPVGRALTRAEQLAVARHVIARGGKATAIQNLLRINTYTARELYEEVTGGADLEDDDDLDGAA